MLKGTAHPIRGESAPSGESGRIATTAAAPNQDGPALKGAIPAWRIAIRSRIAPSRRIGLFRQSSPSTGSVPILRSGRPATLLMRIGLPWQVAPPRESRPLANRPVQRNTPSSESALIRRIGGHPVNRQADARRVAPPLAARQAQGRSDPLSRRKPARALRDRVRWRLRRRAVRKAVASA